MKHYVIVPLLALIIRSSLIQASHVKGRNLNLEGSTSSILVRNYDNHPTTRALLSSLKKKRSVDSTSLKAMSMHKVSRKKARYKKSHESKGHPKTGNIRSRAYSQPTIPSQKWESIYVNGYWTSENPAGMGKGGKNSKMKSSSDRIYFAFSKGDDTSSDDIPSVELHNIFSSKQADPTVQDNTSDTDIIDHGRPKPVLHENDEDFNNIQNDTVTTQTPGIIANKTVSPVQPRPIEIQNNTNTGNNTNNGGTQNKPDGPKPVFPAFNDTDFPNNGNDDNKNINNNETLAPSLRTSQPVQVPQPVQVSQPVQPPLATPVNSKPTIAPVPAVTTGTPPSLTSASPVTVAQTGELRLGACFIALVSANVGSGPTADQYNDLISLTEEYTTQYMKDYYADANPNIQIETVNLRLLDSAINSGIPEARFNIYVEFDAAIVFGPNSDTVTSDEVIPVLYQSIGPDYILNYVRQVPDSPFVTVSEVLFDVLKRLSAPPAP